MNILLLTFGNESSLEIIKSLNEMNRHIVYGCHYDIDNAGEYYLTKQNIIKIPHYNNKTKFINSIKKIINKKNINKIIVTNCKMLKFIYENKDEFKNEIFKFILPKNIENLRLCLYKNELYEYFKEITITPKMYSAIEAENKDVFVKKIFGTSGDGNELIKNFNYNNWEERLKKLKIDKSLFILTEYLPGKEVTVDCLCDAYGNLLDYVIRERIKTRDGITVYGKSIDNNKEIETLLEKITETIDLPYVWFAQFKKDKNNKYKLLEINYRVSGSFCLTKNFNKDFIKDAINIIDNKYKYEYRKSKINNSGKIVRHFNALQINKKRYVVDLDGTLCSDTHGNYFNALPIRKNIDLINKLYNSGAEIIIHTARGMVRYENDINKVYSNLFTLTEEQLKKWGIKYHKLIMGKPTGIYVDNDCITIDELKKRNK